MKWLRALGPTGAALAVAWLVGGPGACTQAAAPQLVQVTDVAPREVERGDTLSIGGDGFPGGKTARVTFRGTLHRPGESPVRGAEVVTSGMVAGPDRVVVALGEATEALFCGAGDLATHTTFEGDVEVAFAAAATGAPPVGGTLSGVVLDVHPAVRAADIARDGEGDRFLGWMGLHVANATGDRASPGLVVDTVAPASRAAAAGLAPGDVLTAFDGVRVSSPGDVLPAPGEREATLSLRRAGLPDEATHTVSVVGFLRAPLERFVLPMLILFAALAIVLLFAAPTPAPLAGLLDGAALRLKSRARAASGGRGPKRAGLAASIVAEAVPPAGPFALADAAAGALLCLLPFGQYLVAAQLDVAVLFLGATTALVTAALVAGRSPVAGAKAALHVVWQHVPGAVAALCVVSSTGSLRLQEISRAQGGWPWEWSALRSPPLLVALALLLACGCVVLAEDEPRKGLSSLVESAGDHRPGAPRGPWLDAALRTHRIVIAGLAVALLLGGWRLPGVSPAVQDARPTLELAGAVLFLAKTGTVVVALAAARSLGGGLSLRERSRSVALRLVPLSLGALGATIAWDALKPGPAVERLSSGLLVVLVASVAAALAARARHAVVAERAQGSDGPGHVSVFL
jgi:NADH-quinone oxidoreductase subunit H